MRRFAIFLISITLFFSCTEEYNWPQNQGDYKIVIEGIITNEDGPYFVRVSKSNPYNNSEISFFPEEEITIYISDDEGNTDTLIPINKNIYTHPVYYNKYILIQNYDGEYDTIRIINDNTEMLFGIYQTTSIIGQAGHDYNISVITKDGTNYYGSDHMYEVPEIDSVNFQKTQESKEGDYYYEPYIFFKDPTELNFYLIESDRSYTQTKYYSIEKLMYDAIDIWEFVIFDDELLQDYVNGLNFAEGIGPRFTNDYFYIIPGETISLRLSSLSSEAYDFFESLIIQIKNDGGIFKPSPANAPNNLSNGALGYFRASAVSVSNATLIANDN